MEPARFHALLRRHLPTAILGIGGVALALLSIRNDVLRWVVAAPFFLVTWWALREAMRGDVKAQRVQADFEQSALNRHAEALKHSAAEHESTRAVVRDLSARLEALATGTTVPAFTLPTPHVRQVLIASGVAAATIAHIAAGTDMITMNDEGVVTSQDEHPK